MSVEAMNPKSPYPWEGQRSDNPKIQYVIERGYWVDKEHEHWVDDRYEITLHCSLYGQSQIDYSGTLPQVVYIAHHPDRTEVVFCIKS